MIVINAPKAAQPDTNAILSPKALKAYAMPPPETGSIVHSSQYHILQAFLLIASTRSTLL